MLSDRLDLIEARNSAGKAPSSADVEWLVARVRLLSWVLKRFGARLPEEVFKAAA